MTGVSAVVRGGGSVSAPLIERFEESVMALAPALYSHALRLTRNRSDAEDLLQDTLLRAYAGFAGFRQGTKLRAWLYRIQTNGFITGWRRRQRRSEVCLFDNLDTLRATRDLVSPARHANSAEDEALLGLPNGDLAAAMRALPDDFRVVVYYADVVGLPLKHIAALADIPVGTVTSRLHRARRRLRAHLAAAAHDSAGRAVEAMGASTTSTAPIAVQASKNTATEGNTDHGAGRTLYRLPTRRA